MSSFRRRISPPLIFFALFSKKVLTGMVYMYIIILVVERKRQKRHPARENNLIAFLVEHCGELSEWLKEHAWKACIR